MYNKLCICLINSVQLKILIFRSKDGHTVNKLTACGAKHLIQKSHFVAKVKCSSSKGIETIHTESRLARVSKQYTLKLASDVMNGKLCLHVHVHVFGSLCIADCFDPSSRGIDVACAAGNEDFSTDKSCIIEYF